MARPHAEHPELRRRRILDAARQVMVRTDYTEFRLDDVARQARLAKGTLYLYFKDKHELIAAVVTDMLRELEERINRASGADALGVLRAVVDVHLAFVDQYHDFFKMIFSHDPVFSRDAASAPMRAGYNAHLDAVSRRLRDAMDAGLLRPCEPRIAALYLLSVMRMIVTLRALQGSRQPLIRQTERVLDLFLNGLGAGRPS